MNKPLTFLLSLTFLFLFSGSVYGDDFQDAWDAYTKEDFKTAYKLFLPLAEQGNAVAQLNLGAMYEFGQGVPQDYKEAVKWYRLSAEQKDATAARFLGRMYYMGHGVIKDYVSAHMWWNICGSDGEKECVKYRDMIEKKMSKQQIEKAQELARNWKPTTK